MSRTDYKGYCVLFFAAFFGGLSCRGGSELRVTWFWVGLLLETMSVYKVALWKATNPAMVDVLGCS